MVKKHILLKHSKLLYVIGLVAAVAILGIIYVLYKNHEKKSTTTIDQYTKGQANQPSSSSSATSKSQNTSESSKVGGSSTTLIVPNGNFVSDHHPNLSGSPAPNSMSSVCNTSPGASCQIFFTNGSLTKSLPAQTADAGGATYWYWKLQDIGLTVGSWKVSATSSLNENSQTSTDPMLLIVSQ